jgi:hypothetical protein
MIIYKKYPEFKKDIDALAKYYEPNLELMSSYYERLDRTQKLSPNLIEFIEKNLKPIIEKQNESETSIR